MIRSQVLISMVFIRVNLPRRVVIKRRRTDVDLVSLLTGCIPAQDRGVSGPVFGFVNRPAPLSVSEISGPFGSEDRRLDLLKGYLRQTGSRLPYQVTNT